MSHAPPPGGAGRGPPPRRGRGPPPLPDGPQAREPHGRSEQQQTPDGGQRAMTVAHSCVFGASKRNRAMKSTAAPNRNSAGRALIQVYCQPGIGAGDVPAVAYSATAS